MSLVREWRELAHLCFERNSDNGVASDDMMSIMLQKCADELEARQRAWCIWAVCAFMLTAIVWGLWGLL